MENNELITSFGKTLFQENFDLTMDYLELTLDAVTENDVLKGFPIVGSIVGLGKTVVAVRDRYLLKKTLEFIKTVNCGALNREKIEKHRQKLLSDPQMMQDELGRVLFLLDNQIDAVKSRILGNFYIHYIQEEMDWEDFTILSDILDFISIYDLGILGYIYERKVLRSDDKDKINLISIKKLDSVGLIEFFAGDVVDIGEYKRIVAKISGVGETFYEIATEISSVDLC